MDTSALSGSVQLINTGAGSSFEAANQVLTALAGLIAAGAFLGAALAFFRAVANAGDPTAFRSAAKDAARIPLAMLAIAGVLIAAPGIYQAFTANSAQYLLGADVYSTNASASNGKISPDKLVPSNQQWNEQGKTTWNWANNPAYPEYDFKAKWGDKFYQDLGYDMFGNYKFTIYDNGVMTPKYVEKPSGF